MLLSLTMNFLRNLFHGLLVPTSITGKIIRHGQYYLIYPPAYDGPLERGYVDCDADIADFIKTDIRTSDGVTLRCFIRKQVHIIYIWHWRSYEPADEHIQSKLTTARGIIIMFHGNTHHAWSYMSCGDKLSALGFDVLMVEYRGYVRGTVRFPSLRIYVGVNSYGASEGKPSEWGIRLDAQAALDFVLAHDDFRNVPVILHGQSLGGGVAVDLASRNPTKIDAMILENTFLSLPRLVKGIAEYLLFTFIIRQRWDSAAKIHKIRRATPILFVCGERDVIVPPWHMLDLRDRALNREVGSEVEVRDVFTTFPRGGLSKTWMEPGYFSVVDDFLGQLKS